MTQSPRSLSILGFCHLGIVMPDIDAFFDSWGALLGIDDWMTRITDQPGGQYQLHGEVIEEPTASRVAFFQFKGVAIELIQPRFGRAASAEWLRENGPGVNHIAMWVDDLPAQLERVSDVSRITYAPVVLDGDKTRRPLTAHVDHMPDQVAALPFWAYIEPLVNPANIALELLDARLAQAFRDRFGAHAFYPGDLPGTSPAT